MPTARGGAGTRRRSTRVKGFAVGMAPAARWASAATACRIRSRPGGTAEVTVVSARPPALASRSARPSRRAAACSSAVGSRVVPETPPDSSPGSRAKTRAEASPAARRAFFSASPASAPPGRHRRGGANSALAPSAPSGVGRAGRRGSDGREVADPDLAGARAQPGPVGPPPADLAGLDPGLLQRGGGGRPGGIRALGGAPAGVRGVRALVDGRAPQGRVPLAVGRVSGVGGGRVDAEVVAVDLDLGAGRDEAGRGTPAGPGGDGYGQGGR